MDEIIETEENQENPRSEISRRLERLKFSALGAVRTRERLPQPLFWSLFLAEVREIKEEKEEIRKQRRAIFGETIV